MGLNNSMQNQRNCSDFSYISYERTDIQRVIFLSDIHLGVKNASIEWLENITKYFSEFFIPLVKQYQEKEKCILIIAGDFFDNRQSLDINVLNKGMDIIEQLSDCIETFMIIGNHDIYKKKDTDITSLRAFTHIPNIHILYNPTVINLSNKNKMLLVPWVGDSKEENNLLSKFSTESINIAVLHSDICGLNYDNGREIVNGVNVSSFNGTKIYSGHIHKRQGSDKVTYLGSPYQMRRSDIGNTKGVYSLEISDNGQMFEYFVENTYSPKFMKLYLDTILEMTAGQFADIVRGNYVDIIIKQKFINKINVSKIIDLADEFKVKKIEIIIDKTEKNEGEEDIVKTNDMTIEEIFSAKLKMMTGLMPEEVQNLQSMNKTYLQQAAAQLNLNI